MTHTPVSCDLLHDPVDDVSDAIDPSPARAEVIALLELNPDGRRLVRLSRRDLAHVDAVAAVLAAARTCTPIPAPRPAVDLTGAL